MKSKAGFTLIEVLIAMFVSLTIMGGAYTVFSSYQKNTTIQTNVSDAQQALSAAMDYVVRDIRMAGYSTDPNSAASFGINDIQFKTLGGVPVSSIRFSWDKNGDGKFEQEWNGQSQIQPDEAEQMEYSLVNNGTITPGVNDLYLKYPGAANSNREVLAANITALGFAYAYDANSDGELDRDSSGNIIWAVDWGNDGDWDSLNLATGVTAETGTSVDTRTIRAVRIWMLAQSQAPDPHYTDTNTYVVGPHIISPNNNFHHRMLERTVLCRNMGLNL